MCQIDRYIDQSLYVWNPPESPWYEHEGCECKKTGWVCSSCNGQGVVGTGFGWEPCRDCQKSIKVEITVEDEHGNARKQTATKIVNADWVAIYRAKYKK